MALVRRSLRHLGTGSSRARQVPHEGKMGSDREVKIGEGESQKEKKKVMKN